MKKILLGLSSVLLIVGSTMGMDGKVERALRRTKSEHSLHTKTTELSEGVTQRPRADTLPVTKIEIKESMEKYAHLIPAGTEKTISVNNTLRKAIIHAGLTNNPDGLKDLVRLICDSTTDYFYANYAYMVFITALRNCFSEVISKLSGMLATIANAKSSGGGAHPNLYWDWYSKGYFNKQLPTETDE